MNIASFSRISHAGVVKSQLSLSKRKRLSASARACLISRVRSFIKNACSIHDAMLDDSPPIIHAVTPALKPRPFLNYGPSGGFQHLIQPSFSFSSPIRGGLLDFDFECDLWPTYGLWDLLLQVRLCKCRPGRTSSKDGLTIFASLLPFASPRLSLASLFDLQLHQLLCPACSC